MSESESLTLIRSDRDTDRPVIVHTYPRRGTVVGDLALCGHVKRDPRSARDIPRDRWDRCVVCADITGRWEVRP